MKLTTTPNVTDALPEQLVGTAPASWWGRWVGTWTFNAIAFITLFAISSFVVLSPTGTDLLTSIKPKTPHVAPHKRAKSRPHSATTEPKHVALPAKAASSERPAAKTARRVIVCSEVEGNVLGGPRRASHRFERRRRTHSDDDASRDLR